MAKTGSLTAASTGRPSQAATEAEIEHDAYRLKMSALVEQLVQLVGVLVAGTVGGAKSERTVRDWITGHDQPEREAQLRFAYRVARMIAESCSPRIVHSWFKGANESLEDRAPAMVLREDFSQEAQRAILDAARRLAQ
ncbi:MAG: hypothetical protein ACXWC3_14745 [Burkholderiales bacterium]